MDEGLGDEAAAVETVDGKYLRGKDVMVGTHEMITPDEGQYRHGSSPAFATVLEGKHPDIDGVSQHVYASPHCTEDAGVMVEELTLRNYNGKSLAVLGTSKSREMMQARKNQWPHLYQTGSGGSGEDAQYGQASSHAWEDDGYTAFSELFSQKPQDDTHNDNLEHPPSNENKAVASSMSTPPGVFRTKILSNSGFSKYFVKNTLKGKGVVFKGPAREGFGGEFRGQTNLKAFNTPKVAFDAPLSSSAKMVVPPACGAGHGVSPSLGEEFRGQTNPKAVNTLKVAFDAPLSPSAKMVVPPACGAGYGVGPSLGEEFRGQTNPKAVNTPKVAFDAPLSLGDKMVAPPACGAGHGVGPSLDAFNGGVNLREWMTSRLYKANKVESLYIFRQIVDFVDFSHSQGLALLDLRPSFFKLLPPNHVIYVGSSTQQDVVLNITDQDNLFSENDRNEKRLLEQPLHPSVSQMVKKQKFGENLNFVKQRSQFSSRSGFKAAVATNSDLGVFGPQDSWNDLNIQHYMKREYKSEGNSSSSDGSNAPQLLSTCTSDPLEEKWYTSPEELSGRGCTFSSNIYALGVLLFELLGLFDSEREHASAMSDLRYRIFPPNFLSENPREAAFCLRLLHPEPSLRLSVRKVLQSDIVKGIVESFGDELSSCMREDDTESELLLHFLLSLKEEKQKDALKLVEEIKFLETDIQEVERRQVKQPLVLSGSSSNPLHFGSELHSKLNLETNTQMRFMENISPLESAYFSTRSKIQLFDDDFATRTNKELLEERGDEYWAQKDEGRKKPRDHLGTFFSGLCKYARYSKFEVRGILRNGDFHNSANVICSLSFDRDQEYFAAAGVSKRIKIYDFQALFNEAVDFHYPANEMSNKSKLSCICWNSYIRNYLASTDYDGIVKLWDAGTGQDFSQYIEHNKRAWSVDFSQVDPTKFASGSDDCSVKVWNINERNSLCTIRNIANICCVQFSSHSSHLLAFGSSDYKTYCYDLRNVSSPWCVLAGHEKAVSYVKFLDSETLVSASTDNTLKLWDLNTTSSTSQSTTSILTLEGHTNEKNFVGLSVADGYIACGSETNEVYAYYRSLPMPITSYKFGSINPISGKETDDDDGQFVSSVCWRKNSDMLVVANSTGCMKVLQMV